MYGRERERERELRCQYVTHFYCTVHTCTTVPPTGFLLLWKAQATSWFVVDEKYQGAKTLTSYKVRKCSLNVHSVVGIKCILRTATATTTERGLINPYITYVCELWRKQQCKSSNCIYTECLILVLQMQRHFLLTNIFQISAHISAASSRLNLQSAAESDACLSLITSH